ncbi:hypothetical protein MB9_0454 [Methanobacterium formicicum]|uniref:Uncharacterized protein n=1 Tax=Methanobacterium formicicum TaxID=2162 RepID=A0A0S4FM39_METFO|nr:hypothetical protein MB9_0454 [Methanobacterium formicicum]
MASEIGLKSDYFRIETKKKQPHTMNVVKG